MLPPKSSISAASVKPWRRAGLKWEELFWSTAGKTPFLGAIHRQIFEELDAAKAETVEVKKSIYNSTSYRVGHALLWLPQSVFCGLRRLFKR